MQSLLAAILVVLALILLSLWVVVYLLVKQRGTLLLRVDSMAIRRAESRLAAADGLEIINRRRAERGLAPGTPSPPFRLGDTKGDEVSLEDLRGKSALLVHWSPHCGFCARIAGDLAGLQESLAAHDVRLVFVAHGGPVENQGLAAEHGLTATFLLIPGGEDTPLLFHGFGTPVAYLLDAEGRVARPVAIGSDGVLELARAAAAREGVPTKERVRLPGEKPLSQSKLERNGIKAGTVAPTFELPEIRGGTVSLVDYRGRRVLLVFSDPHCGPCEQLAPHLNRIHRRAGDGGPAVLVVSRGELEENRTKAEKHGAEYPVALQPRWELSREYGIFATPVAFLVGEDGLIERDVAKGVDAILALAAARPAVAGGGR